MDNNILNYFNFLKVDTITLKRELIKYRKNRLKIKGLKKAFYFGVGDVLEVFYLRRNMALMSSGICISIKKKKMLDPNTSFIIRNVIMNVCIECSFLLYYNRVYNNMIFLDHKRKFYFYNKNKIFFLRNKMTRQSKV